MHLIIRKKHVKYKNKEAEKIYVIPITYTISVINIHGKYWTQRVKEKSYTIKYLLICRIPYIKELTKYNVW